jgi:hypothetical protein
MDLQLIIAIDNRLDIDNTRFISFLNQVKHFLKKKYKFFVSIRRRQGFQLEKKL